LAPWLLGLLCLWGQPIAAQQPVWHFKGTPPAVAAARSWYQQHASMPLPWPQRLDSLLHTWQQAGYWQASIDSVQARPDTLHIWVYRGPQYNALFWQPDSLQQNLWQHTQRQAPPTQTTLATLKKFRATVLAYWQNQGYPFVQWQQRLQAWQPNAAQSQTANSAQAPLLPLFKVHLDQGPRITFDSIEVQGTQRVSPAFMAAYLGIQPGAPYQSTLLKAVPARLAYLPWLRLEQPLRVAFRYQKAAPRLTLATPASSSFEGLAALVPRRTGQGLRLTGRLDLQLQNLFRAGHALQLRWQQFEAASQTLNLSYSYPHIAFSPLSASASFYLLKQDTLFLNTRLQLQLQKKLSPALQMGLSLQSTSSSLLQGTSLQANDTLRSYQGTALGLQVQWQPGSNLASLSTRPGFAPAVVQAQVQARRRQLPGQESLGLAPQQNLQWGMQAQARFSLPLGPKALLVPGVQAAWLSGSNHVVNELHRLGGMQNIRGFAPNRFFASYYALAQLEYRFALGTNGSYFMAFTDQGLLAQRLQGTQANPAPSQAPIYLAGLGAGASLRVGQGQLLLQLATGHTANQTISLQGAVWHISYEALF